MNALKLLVVDDDEVDRRAVARALRTAHVDAGIVEAATPAEAVAAVSAGGIDCVLLDYNLPGTTAFEMLAALGSSGAGSRIPVICLTGQGGEEIAVEIMKAGAADYLNKNGLTPERLARSIRYAIALNRSEEERRQLLGREQQAREEAQAANRAKDEFLATLSHELRTPLNAILGWTKLLASGHLDAQARSRALEIIDRNAHVQSQLIEDLLDISRIITGKLALQREEAALADIIDASIEAVRPAADTRQVAIDAGALGDGITVLCDPARIQQVVWNLLSNAVKFTPAGKRVSVAAERLDGHAVITVRDEGVGIDPAFLPFVFERFRQQDGATTRHFGGLGLGLSIVRHLVALHGGTVQADSDGEGRGATFTVRLPVDGAAASPID